jgi:hypothetical protein
MIPHFPVRPLLLQLQPFEDESFQGYLRRCLAANGIPGFSWISKLLGLNCVQKFHPPSMGDEVIANLSIFLGLKRGFIRDLMGRSYGPHGYGKRRVSPKSLRLAPYDRLIWNEGPLPYCPYSLEMLIERCPHCNIDLRWKSTLPIVLCQNCLEDLRKHNAALVPETQRKLAIVVANLLSFKQHERACAVQSFPHDFSPFPARLLFDAGLQLGRITRHGFHRNSLVRQWQSTLRSSYDLTYGISDFLAGFELLMSWPHGLQQLFKQARQQRTIREYCTMMANLRAFASEGHCPQNFADLILAQLPALVDDQRRSFSEYSNDCKFDREYEAFRPLAGLFTHREAADHLGVKMQFLADAKRLGYLPDCVPGVRGTLFRKADLDLLTVQLSERVPIRQAKRAFGMSSLALEQLLAVGLLSRLDNTIIGLMNDGPFVLKGELNSLVGRICEMAGKAVPKSDLVAVGGVMRSIGARDKPWATFIGHVLAQDIPIYPGIQPTIALDSFRVRKADVPAIRNMTFSFETFPNFERSRALSGPEWAEYLNVGKVAKEVIVKDMLLPVDIASLRYVCPLDAVVALANRVISIWEIRARLSASALPLPLIRDVLNKYGLQSNLNAWLWCRKDISENFGTLSSKCKQAIGGKAIISNPVNRANFVMS